MLNALLGRCRNLFFDNLPYGLGLAIYRPCSLRDLLQQLHENASSGGS